MVLGVLACLSIGAAAWQLKMQMDQYRQTAALYPRGSTVAGLAVGGLNFQQAAQRVTQFYNLPVELHIEGSVIQISPAKLGFELDLPAMFDEHNLVVKEGEFWPSFWNYLWQNGEARAIHIPLQAQVDPARIRTLLENEVAPRFNQAAQPARAVVSELSFQAGRAGAALQVDAAVDQIAAALRSTQERVVSLATSPVAPLGPEVRDLETFLRIELERSGFAGITEIYVQGLDSTKTLDLAFQRDKVLPPGIAFTAASTIKIPIMISVFRRVAEPTPADVLQNLEAMIEISENEPADWLMKNVIDPISGPLQVSQDMHTLGLKNTFLAGYFYQGAPLLQIFETPANQRKDYFTDPDPYNQTTPEEMGRLLVGIYQCAEQGNGLLTTAFNGQISAAECQQMVTLLFGNHMPMLAAAGTPDGIKIAHKHGWVIEANDGLMHSICDAGIVYSPGGDYVVTIYRWSKDQILFDPANIQIARLSEMIYGFFNPAAGDQ